LLCGATSAAFTAGGAARAVAGVAPHSLFPARGGLMPSAAAARGGAGGTAALPAIAASATWGTAKEPRGMTALNHGGDGALVSVSCPAKGTCSAAGLYDDATPMGSGRQALTVGEEGGAWGAAQPVPAAVALNVGKTGEFQAVSCASAGNCGGGGDYQDATGTSHSLVVTEAGGTWTGAKEVPGSLPPGGRSSAVTAESCPAVGRCTIAGYLRDSDGNEVAYVDSQQPNHAWGAAMPVAGLPATGFYESVDSLSCRSPGNCAAGGFFQSQLGPDVTQVWVVSEVNGVWHKAKTVAAALNKGNSSNLGQVSCGSPGNCVAVGYYSPAPSQLKPFIEAEKNGAWQPVITLTSLGTLASLDVVSCASAGNCTAGGSAGGTTGAHAIVVTEKNGTWGKTATLPGLAALDTGHGGYVAALSCVSPGNCAAAGDYEFAGNKGLYVWVAGQRHGVWGNAALVPGLNALNAGKSAGVGGLSCATLGGCGMVGYYTDGSGHAEPWVVAGAIAVPTTARLALSTGTVRFGHEQAEKVSVSVTAANGRRPPGRVTVTAGSVTLCVITLTMGTGSCHLAASKLRPGSYPVAAVYDGSHDYQGSNVAKKTLKVTK
jgi:hypothetical protein